jgi:acetyl-CoA C-acetyltransferase
MDPRTPVIVGAAQRTYREDPPQPLHQMAEVARAAVPPKLLSRLQSVAVVESFSWPVADPGAALSAELGIEPCETVRSARGGNGPLALLGDAAQRVTDGVIDAALVVGAEAMTPYMRAVKAGEETGWADPGGEPGRVVGADRDASHPLESEAGLIAPIFYYPLIEHAHRAAAGRSVDEHADWVASWWSRFSDVAAAHEHAWSRTALSAEEVASPGGGNRLVSSPYTKVMNANIQVDQAAAVVVCSAETADAIGVPRDEWVFVHGSAGAEDEWFVGERADLHRSPAIAAIFDALGRPEVEHLDLYSCFPSAVQTAALELGLDLDAVTPTVTGGLAFFGGPANNYTTHSVVTLVDRLRESPSQPTRGLATAVGWYLTKHHALLLGSEPAAYRSHAPSPGVARTPIVEGGGSAGVVESFTALYDRDGSPTMGIVAARLGGGRAFGRSHDPQVVGELLATEAIGRTVRVDGAEFSFA